MEEAAMAKRRKVRKCRICKKSPVWRGGDVKNPGPYCKKCYHKHVWKYRPGSDDDRDEMAGEDMIDFLIETVPPPPVLVWIDLSEPLRGPDEDEWEWICATSWGEPEILPESPPDLEAGPHPDEDDWAWI